MTAPLAPQSRATSVDGNEPANESAFPEQPATPAATAATGWDPYEVWRTRVFAAQPPDYKKR
jgi:hypothetical protein